VVRKGVDKAFYGFASSKKETKKRKVNFGAAPTISPMQEERGKTYNETEDRIVNFTLVWEKKN